MSALVRRTTAVLGLAALTASAAACGGGNGGGDGGGKDDAPSPTTAPPAATAPGTGLMDALSLVKANERTRRHLAYSDLGTLRKLAGGTLDRSPLASLAVGLGDMFSYGRLVAPVTGIDPAQATAALQAGVPPSTAGHMAGTFDSGAIGRKLGGLGYKQGGDTWTLHPDGKIDMNDPLVRKGLSPTHQLNTVRMDAGGGLSFARLPASLDNLKADGAGSLAADPAFKAAANCLNAPLAAMFFQKQDSGDLLSVGTRGTAQNALDEVMCVVTKDPGHAVEHLREELAGRKSATGRPWSQVMPDARVEKIDGGAVRLTFRPAAGTRPGVLFGAIVRDDLPHWSESGDPHQHEHGGN